MKPLTGVRVIDLGIVFAGPVACTLLADFGAEVFKVERPGRGDRIRETGHAYKGTSLWWSAEGRNKKSITLDWSQPEGRRLLLRLVALSDVLVENFRPGRCQKHGLSDAVLHSTNPRLIIAHISGFGQDGPMREGRSYDGIASAFSGLTYLTGYPDRPPVRTGAPLADYTSAVFTALGVMFALYRRDLRDGKGEVLDVALYESIWRLMGNVLPTYDKLGVVREREGTRSPGGQGITVICSSVDGDYVVLTVSSITEYTRLAEAIGRPDLLRLVGEKDERGRPVRQEEIENILREWIANHTREQALTALESAGVPAGPVNSIADIVKDPQYLLRGMMPEVDDPHAGRVKVPGVVPKLARHPGKIETPAPLLGQHNEEVYGGLLGISHDELAALKARRVL